MEVVENKRGEIVMYQPDETIRLEVRLEDETVWLTQAQMAELFGRERSVIAKHIGNCFREGELQAEEVCAKFAQTTSHGAIKGKEQTHEVAFYNLDVIISVGYRVKSSNGTRFRQWATKVLKSYILQGAAISYRQLLLHSLKTAHILAKLTAATLHSHINAATCKRLEIQGIFCQGQVFSAHLFVENLIKSAQREIILIDNYVDASVFDILEKREQGVDATIYTERVGSSLIRLQQLNQQQYGRRIEVKEYNSRFHDRFLILDDALYHFGASFKDLGKRLFAFERMGIEKSVILSQL